MTGHLIELLPAEAETLAAAARILAERCVGAAWGVGVVASAGHARLVVHMQSGTDLELDGVALDDRAAEGLAASVRVHNARRSAL